LKEENAKIAEELVQNNTFCQEMEVKQNLLIEEEI
jgi:hypothetical protein